MAPEFWELPAIQDALHSKQIGQLFRAYRKARRPVVTQTTLAAWLGLPQSYVSDLERGSKRATNLERLEQWCDALHVPPHLRWFRGPSDASPGVPVQQGNSLEELGLVYAASLPTTVDVVANLGRHDMERRRFLTGAMFAVAASVAPSRDWLIATLETATSTRGKVNNEQVDAIRRTFGVFQELDVMRGGGHARTQLAAYLSDTVVPLLKTNDPETDTGAALYEAAAEQLYLLGWMAFDNGEHSVAQRYLIQSLRLAQAAGNVELGAHVLAGLSDQATLTGNPDQGVQLARAGRAGLAKGYSPACLADLHALQARAEAAMGDAKAAAQNVHLSEKAFESADPENEPEWARFIDVAYLNGEYAHTFRDLERPEEASMFARVSAADSERQNRARRGSLAQAALARAAIDAHDLPAAASAGLAAAKLAATVKSSRSVEAVADLRLRLRDHSGSPAVREFLDVSGALMPAM
jgi:transcriptional regulator with XRE-family HTH domain